MWKRRRAEFPDPDPVEGRKLTIDQRLARALRHWSIVAPNSNDLAQAAEREVASILEWWLCEAFRYNPVKSNRDWWSDGVLQLLLTQRDEFTLLAAGVTIWADSDAPREFIAPFEIEFYLSSDVEDQFRRTIVRFGRLGDDGLIHRVAYGKSPHRVFEDRPRTDSNWALAIELTDT